MQEWLAGVAEAVAQANRDSAFGIQLAIDSLHITRESSALKIGTALRAARQRVEAEMPTLTDALIATGDQFGAFTQIVDIVGTAKTDVWIVDPWMEIKALRLYGLAVPEGVPLRLFATTAKVNELLRGGSEAWRETHGAARPLEVRLAAQKALHDRFIAIDQQEIWLLSQSLNAFADRAPGTVVQFSESLVKEKLAAYTAIWDKAERI